MRSFFHDIGGRSRFVVLAAAALAECAFAKDCTVRAVGDGVADDTAAIQQAVDEVSASGGGRVTVPKGVYMVCSVALKSNVELHLEKDASLVACTNLEYFTKSVKDRKVSGKAVIVSCGAKNIAITGEGTVDGRGWALNRLITRVPHITLTDAWQTVMLCWTKGVRIEGVKLLGASSWTLFLKRCEDVTIRGINLFAHANYCNDGIDIDARNVLIERCEIDAEDDAVCFKTHYANEATENVEVRWCKIASNSGVVKFGTETKGPFRNIRVHHCLVRSKAPSHTIDPHRFPGEDPAARSHALSGLEFNVCEGGSIEDVVLSDLVLDQGLNVPIYFSCFRAKGIPDSQPSYLRNVRLERIKMRVPASSAVGNFIRGRDGFRPSDITLRDVELEMLGGGADAGSYNEHQRKRMCPAYGFTITKADRVLFENVKIRYADGRETRPAVVVEDADVKFSGCDFMAPKGGAEKVVINKGGSR